MQVKEGDGLPVETQLIALLLSLPGFGVAQYWRLHSLIGDIGNLRHWPLAQLFPILPSRCHPALVDIHRRYEQSQVWDDCRQRLQALPAGVSLVTHRDPAYPALLATTHEPPPLLYVAGDIDVLSLPQLAFVGSRNATRYGLGAAFDFARCLAQAGIAITSGLAVGIDGSAHRGALAAGGITLAVLGTGIDVVYPSRHRQLAAEIVASGGALISEFPPGTQPYRSNFPRRNRIISGLSLGVLVVEAAVRSGSLITAGHALEQNRDVFALPGSINNPLSRGCHQLLRDGAILVETAADIGRELGHWLSMEAVQQGKVSSARAGSAAKPNVAGIATREDRALWSALDYEPSSIDDLVQRCNQPAAAVLARLSGWELQGLVVKDRERYLRSPGL